MIRSNIHTHSVYCDGKNTLSELAEAAYSSGFTSLGFSSHAYTDFDTSFCMKRADAEKYFEEADNLKKEYSGRLEIYKGLEYDIFSCEDISQCDYIIGAVHYIRCGNDYLCVDESLETTKKIINEFFGGNAEKYAAVYFETMSSLTQNIKFDIVAHFDLVTKFNEKERLIDTSSYAYKTAATDALTQILKTHEIFEINTGAIARGYRHTPYPDSFILKELCQRGGQIVISSDCHDKSKLCCHFGDAVNILKHCGFKSHLELHCGKFTECEL